MLILLIWDCFRSGLVRGRCAAVMLVVEQRIRAMEPAMGEMVFAAEKITKVVANCCHIQRQIVSQQIYYVIIERFPETNARGTN